VLKEGQLAFGIAQGRLVNHVKARKRGQVSTIDTLCFCDMFGEGHNNHELKTLVEWLEAKLASVRS
jgi:hypothetical protein